jgi:spermidine/putrescine transport system substrate-binding protein
MRKFLMVLLVLALAVPVFAQDEAEIEPWVCPEGYEGQTLSVYNWSTYIADDTVPNFEELCGVTVTYDIFESGEALLARIRQGNPGYDIAVPSDITVSIMAGEGLLVPLNKDLIPNMANVSEDLLDPPYDPDNTYSMPYQWGTVGIGYNVEEVGEITSWADMFAYDGTVAWLDDRRAMFGIALQILGFDPNSTDADEINQARDYLLENGSNVVAIAADDGQVLLERGDVDITVEYSGDIIDLTYECECDTYAYLIPEEGTNIWIDNMVIPVDAPNAELAMVFMDYILHPQVSADISNFTAYASPNAVAIENGLIDEELLADTNIYPTDEAREKFFFQLDMGAEVEELYNNAWDEMLIFLGQ